MKLSTRARYALRAMIEFALKYGEGPVMLKEVAKAQNISDKYLEQVLTPLRARGFVHTLRGNKGGYYLSGSPEDISVYDIIEVVEGSLAPAVCVDNPETCSRVDTCVTREIWCNLKNTIRKELGAVSLASLAEKQKRNEGENPE